MKSLFTLCSLRWRGDTLSWGFSVKPWSVTPFTAPLTGSSRKAAGSSSLPWSVKCRHEAGGEWSTNLEKPPCVERARLARNRTRQTWNFSEIRFPALFHSRMHKLMFNLLFFLFAFIHICVFIYPSICSPLKTSCYPRFLRKMAGWFPPKVFLSCSGVWPRSRTGVRTLGLIALVKPYVISSPQESCTQEHLSRANRNLTQ